VTGTPGAARCAGRSQGRWVKDCRTARLPMLLRYAVMLTGDRELAQLDA
jgi:hypothetical protein